MKKAQSWANDCYTGCFKAKFPNSYLWRRTLTGIRSTNDLRPTTKCYGLDIISSTHGDRVTFVKRRLGPPCFCHNEMVSCFEAVCVTIASPALDFLLRHRNLSPFTEDFRGEGELYEYIGNFSQDLVRPDLTEKIEKV